MYTFLEELTGSIAGSDKEKALACQAAEHQYAGHILTSFFIGLRTKEFKVKIAQKVDVVYA